jgi:hypothetical protein
VVTAIAVLDPGGVSELGVRNKGAFIGQPHPGLHLRTEPAPAVTRSRWLQFAEALSPAASAIPGDWAPCSACAELLSVSGASIALMSGDAPYQLCASDEVATTLEELQFTLGEGPSSEAHHSGEPVAEPRMSDAQTRWPAFAGPAADAGAGAIFAFPLRIGAAALGVLCMYQRSDGPLSPAQHADALGGWCLSPT